MRVISGLYKGRNILGYNILGTRPTMDRVKMSIFSMIQSKLPDSICLDLFAGSGSYGIEAISNLAKFVYFNDFNKLCIKTILKNLNNFNITDKYNLLSLDYKKCLEYLKKNKLKFDIVFLDPPYKLDCLNEILLYLETNHLLNKKCLVIVEFTNDNLAANYGNLFLKKEKKYGDKLVYIYEEVTYEDK